MLQETALGILKTGRNVYLTGAAGTGKTHLLNEYISYLRQHNVGIGVTASTGIAATHLNGMTIHAWSGIGIKDYLSEWDIDALTQRQPLVKRFERTDVLIIDEVSMLRPEILDAVDQVARAMKRNELPFGGMQIVLSGDFFQLPPIVRGGASEEFVDSSQAWYEGDFRVCYLTEQYRQEGGKLLNILNDIRDGGVTQKSRDALHSRVLPATNQNSEAVVLHTHNKNVDERNTAELKKIDADSTIYEMATSGRANLVETLKKSVLAPEQLELKVGARVIFVKNSPDQEYVNGTLGEVVSLDEEYPIVRTHDGREVTALPVSWETIDDGKVLASVTQVPLRLAWAITIHKSQGMSLDAAEVDLSGAFTPGQGYVALSRVRKLDGLYIHGFNETALSVHPYVQARDVELQRASEKWEHVFSSFSPEKISTLQSTFLEKVARDTPSSQSVPTHMQTLAFLQEGLDVQQIAERRGVTVGTIIGHLEKIKESVGIRDFEQLRPAEAALREVVEAFNAAGTQKLAPVHKKLHGKYTYEELRLARLFVEV